MMGTVEFFNNRKGWGKINGDDGCPYFVHHRSITDARFFPEGKLKRYRTLTTGQRVHFEPQKNEQSMDSADKVTIVDSEKEVESAS